MRHHIAAWAFTTWLNTIKQSPSAWCPAVTMCCNMANTIKLSYITNMWNLTNCIIWENPTAYMKLSREVVPPTKCFCINVNAVFQLGVQCENCIAYLPWHASTTRRRYYLSCIRHCQVWCSHLNAQTIDYQWDALPNKETVLASIVQCVGRNKYNGKEIITWLGPAVHNQICTNSWRCLPSQLKPGCRTCGIWMGKVHIVCALHCRRCIGS